jgi:hypothetical protein
MLGVSDSGSKVGNIPSAVHVFRVHVAVCSWIQEEVAAEVGPSIHQSAEIRSSKAEPDLENDFLTLPGIPGPVHFHRVDASKSHFVAKEDYLYTTSCRVQAAQGSWSTPR